MKSNVQRKGILAHRRPAVGTSKVRKDTNRQKECAQIASGGVLPFSCTEEVPSRQLVSVIEPSIGRQKEISLHVDPLAKMKLQLFPVDEVTRIGLEKDGLNPFLELTLRARKKISSVIKHINAKWGGSSIAVGETMLLPYDDDDGHLRRHSEDDMSRRSWTLKDTVISAGDVYTSLQTPDIFRLSYGWFSVHDGPQRVSAAATMTHNCINSESMQKVIETTEEMKKCSQEPTTTQLSVTELVDTEAEMGDKHEQSISPPQYDDDDGITHLATGGHLCEASGMEKICNNESKSSWSKIDVLPGDISIGGLLSEASLQGKLHNNNSIGHEQQTQFRWDDSITALSIGGLLSEASLQAKINNKPDPKPPSLVDTFISDSFDAAAIISSQVKNNLLEAVKPSSLDVLSSILDAEETCHAFAFRKLSSSNSKNVRVIARATQDSTSNPFRFPHLQQEKKQFLNAEDTSYNNSEPKTELFPRPLNLSEDSRSVGLRGLTWNESLGPFDLGNSLLWKG